MKIFFLRHGKAEERLNGLEDAIRALTKEGIDLLKQDLPYLAHLLNNYDTVRVWTSPLLRAKQTTTILVEKLKSFNVEVEAFLATGDTQILKQKLLDLNEEPLVLVGHNPFFDDWVTLFCSEGIAIKKGETVMVELLDKENFRGRILARLQPQLYACELNRLRLSDFFKEKHAAICKEKELFLSAVDHPKRVHNFRISIRRYRSLLSLFKPLFLDKVFKTLDRKVSMLLKNLFYLRELDVLISRYESYLGDNKTSVLLSVLKDFRKEEERRVKEIVASPDYDPVLSDVFRETINAFSLKSLREVNLDRFIELRIGTLYNKIKKTEQKLDIKNIDDLHRYRICWKKLRYALEITDLDEKKKKFTAAKITQDLLGDICDIDVNIELMKKIFSKNYDNVELLIEKNLFIEKEEERMRKLKKELVNSWK